jgi:lysophospholipase L1-like esterase
MKPLPKFPMCPGIVLAVLCSLPFAALGEAVEPAQTPVSATPVTAPPDPAVVPKDRLNESWWAARHKAIVDELPSHKDAQIVLIGDSITNNYDKAKPPNEDFQPIWQQYYAPRKGLNLGFSGDTTANVLWRLDHGEVEGLHPKLAVLLIGTNNTGFFHQTAEQTEAGIDAVIEDLEQRLPETKILLLGILPTRLPSKDLNFDVNAYLGARYAGGKDTRVSYLDVSVIFYQGGSLNDSIFYDPYMNPPRASLHPNTEGQRKMASAIEPTVARLMGDTPIKPSAIPAAPSTQAAQR